MIVTLAVAHYRSLTDIVLPLGPLNVITGANGSGKSNLYRALRLLAETAQGGLVQTLAREGGLSSALWAGAKSAREPVHLRLGFAGEDFGYGVDLGFPPPPIDDPEPTEFLLDPEIKRESIWRGPAYRPASALVERAGAMVKVRMKGKWRVAAKNAKTYDSMFSLLGEPEYAPEAWLLRGRMAQWRFYDHFRTDPEAPTRQPQLAVRTPVLHHDGRDLAAALQTIREIGDGAALDKAVGDAFPGGGWRVLMHGDHRLTLEFSQEGLLRPLRGTELSDGTLRFFLLAAALLTPSPPPLLVLNEPENSLHPDLLPALAGLIVKAAEQNQVWVVSHSRTLVEALRAYPECRPITLVKVEGRTQIAGQGGMLETPLWRWPAR